MQLIVPAVILLSALVPATAQDKGIEIDLLSRFYSQSGDHSAVTGGEGTEDLDTTSPILVIQYTHATPWSFNGEFGVENVSSASLDRIDQESANVSSASAKDNRAFCTLGATYQRENRSLNFALGFSKEYDYRSLNAGLGASFDFNEKNTTLSFRTHHYEDSLDLIDIQGVNQGEADRTTTDFQIGLTQVINPYLVGTLSVSRSDQSGFLSAPFQEVHLRSGEVVPERLPDARERDAVWLQVNASLTPKFVQRTSYRYYTDSWEIDAHALELESHFKVFKSGSNWLYPFARYYTQTGSPYFGTRQSFDGDESFFTSDWDLSTFDSLKYGIGFRRNLEKSGFSRWSLRASYYDRDDGLNSFSIAGGLGWSL